MIPVAHLIGTNMDTDTFYQFLREFLTDKNITKICHNYVFESSFSYKNGIVIQAPVYDTICAAQMTLKAPGQFRKLSDSGLKTLALNLCKEPLPSFTAVTEGRNFDELDPADPETIRYSCADADFALRLYKWNSLPTQKVTGNSGTENEQYNILWYRVVETSAPDWTSSVLVAYDEDGNKIGVGEDVENFIGQTGSRENPIKQGIENSVDEETLHISKQWTNLYADDEDKSTTWNSDHTINWPDGYEVGYKVVRKAYLISITDDDTQTVSRTDIDGNESSYEQKSVSYGHNRLPIDEWTLDPLMTGTLSASQPYFDLEDLPKGAIIKTNDNPPAGLFANYTYAVEYEYEVVETSITRNGVTEETNVTADQETDTTDSAKVNATITNDLTNIEVRKIWAGDSENDHDHETVTVQLYKSSQRPDGVVPATTKEITIQVPLSGFTGGPRTDFAGGYITVLVTGDDGSTRTATLSPENWLATVEVPDISASTGSDINYTVSVTGVDGAIISAASVSGDDTVLAGDTVYLTATMTEQQYIQQFTLKFNNTWWGENNTWTTVDAPTSGSITATITRKDNNQSTTYTLSADNNWGKDGIELDKNTAAGDYLTYKIALSADGTEIVRMNNWNNTEYTASESEDTKTIDYQAIVKQLVLTDGGVTCTEKGFKKQFEPGEDIIITITYGNNSWGAFDVVYQGETIFSFTDSMKGTSGTKIVSAKAPTSGVANISIIQNSWAVDSISASSVSSQTALSLAKSTSMSMKMPKLGLTTRTIMATTAVPNKTFTITGTGDKTPLDAEAVGDPITLSSTVMK